MMASEYRFDAYDGVESKYSPTFMTEMKMELIKCLER